MAYEILCVGCAAQFVSKVSYTRYCSMACRVASKKAKPKHCVNCQCLFTPVKFMRKTGRFVSYNAGKTCSAACETAWRTNNEVRKLKISIAFTGDKHPNWQGGKAKLNNISNRGTGWQKQRRAALARDGRCKDCGLTAARCVEVYGRGLDVDHVVPFHNFADHRKANALSNLECRCASCHRIAEAKRGMVQMVLPYQDSLARTHKGYARGEMVNTATLSRAQVLEMRRRGAAGEMPSRLAKEFDTSIGNACNILKGKTWRHLLPAT